MENSVPPLGICSEQPCDGRVWARGMCQKHYRRAMRRHSAPTRACKRCGNPIPAGAVGRRRDYCDETCRRPKSDRVRATDLACTEPGCEKYPKARGYCERHYHQHRLAGDFGGQNCTAPGCDRLGATRGFCQVHYRQAREAGLITATQCDVDECFRPVQSSGLCNMHLMRVRTHGEPGDATLRRAPAGSGYIDPNGYVNIGVDGRRVLQHRYVMEQRLGRPLLPEESVHHVNGERADNRPENLELWSSSHPYGQRVEDKVAWAIELLSVYAPEALARRSSP